MSYDDEVTTLLPGVYCGGIEIKNNSDITFSDGIYVIKDGKFFIDSNTTAQGTEVAFFLTGTDAVINFNSNTVIDFSAPSSGPMKGVIFFQDRDYGGTHLWDSNNASEFDGVIYLPNGDIEFNSNSSTFASPGSGCTILIAYRIVFDSNSGLELDADFSQCPGGAPGYAGITLLK